ncbi:contractile injection system protein, VgrG/Pvc8 family [Rhodanobacter sp. 115]|uniref:contractile injection system protein, VgrG/Pvc8 family n=1 Tax=Rhodanobacter sp. FW021-MT20 TaxID=1162282 RepID=UPI000260F849|nr:phage late control D family protein [Rhodanobacter sp. 115]EIM00096.1 Rhs element Vgr protein [Rhodanobacter sp. 115]
MDDLDYVSASAFINLKPLLGQPIGMGIATATGGRCYWHGIVTHAASLGADDGLARYRLDMQSGLALRRNTLIFQDRSALDVVTQVLADYPQLKVRTEVTTPLRTRSSSACSTTARPTLRREQWRQSFRHVLASPATLDSRHDVRQHHGCTTMRHNYKPEQKHAILMAAAKVKVTDIPRCFGISIGTYYNWRHRFDHTDNASLRLYVQEKPLQSSALHHAALYGIYRRDYIPSQAGWQVRIHRRGRIVVDARFRDKDYGGADAALRAAQAHRDLAIRRHTPMQLRERNQILRRNNTTGVPGVTRVLDKGKYDLFCAATMLPDGRRLSRRFSIAKYGECRAFELAVAARQEQLERVKGVLTMHPATNGHNGDTGD